MISGLSMRVVHVGEGLSRELGGTAAACAELASHLAAAGADVSVLTLVNGHGSPWPLDARVVAKAARRRGPRRFGYAADVPVVLDSLAPSDVMHVHGLWRLQYLQAARFATRRDVPFVVSVHGMLHRPALQQRGVLKRAARVLFQNALLKRARCLHATAHEEAEEIRRAGFDRPIAVIPWGVEVPDAERSRQPGMTTDGSARTLLYLGRLHPSKGLDPLLRAWARIHVQFPMWRLMLAGYDEDNYRAALTARAAELGVTESVILAGPVEEGDRERTFAQSDIVVLPSPAENFGFVVPEALARGVPVIATHGSPWSSLTAADCGWWIPAGEESLVAALQDALARPAPALVLMGERGRHLALEQFSWDRVAAGMIELYEWMLDRRPQPSFVTTGN